MFEANTDDILKLFQAYIIRIGIKPEIRDWHLLIIENFVKAFLPENGMGIFTIREKEKSTKYIDRVIDEGVIIKPSG